MIISKAEFSHAAVHAKGVALGVYRLTSRWANQKHACGFQAGHFDQVELSAFHARLQLCEAAHVVGMAYQGAVIVVSPCVVRAAKAVLRLAAMLDKMALGIKFETYQTRAPVAADIQKCFDATVSGAGQKNGCTGQVAGEPGAGRG